MKKYIREILDDIRKKRNRDFIPPAPKPEDKAPVLDYNNPPEPPMPFDLENQILSKNHQERVRQLDYQAQESEEEQTLGS